MDFLEMISSRKKRLRKQKKLIKKKTTKQMKKIIKKEFSQYLNGFKKMLRKNRISRSPLYRESSLINFKDELLIR